MKKYFQQIDWAKTVSYAVAATAVVLVYVLFSHIGTLAQAVGKVFYYLSSFLTGVIIAYILSPLSQWIQNTIFKHMRNRRSANALAVLITFLLLFGVVALIFSFAIPQLADSISTLASNLTGYFSTFEAYMLNFSKLELVQHLGLDWNTFLDIAENILNKIKTWLTENPNDIANAVVNVGSSVVNIIISLIISIYVLLDWKRFVFNFKRFGKAILGDGIRLKMKYVALRSDNILKGFIRSNLLDALIIGVLNFLFMLIMGMPYNLLISVIVGFTNIIPTFGPIIGYVPCALILVLINPWQALWFSIFTVVLQMCDSNIIKPLVFKDAVGISPLWVLVSIIVGARISGIAGMLLAIPVTGIIAFLLEDFIRAQLAKKGIEDTGIPDDDMTQKNQRKDLRRLLRQRERARRKVEKDSAK